MGGGVDSSTIVGYPTSSAPAPYKGATNGREFYTDGDGEEGVRIMVAQLKTLRFSYTISTQFEATSSNVGKENILGVLS